MIIDDILHPFDEQNQRDEYILVEYDNVFDNTNYLIIQKMISMKDKLDHEYSELKPLMELDPVIVYMTALLTKREDLLSFLSNFELTSEDTQKELISIENKVNFVENEYRTHMWFAINNLLYSDRIKKVIFFSKNFLLSKQKRMILLMQDHYFNDKLIAEEDTDIINVIKNYPELTSIICQSDDIMYRMIENNLSVEGKAFLFPNTLMNADIDQYRKDGTILLHEKDKLENYYRDHKCVGFYFTPKFMTPEEF